jgi:membrane fusion protein
MSSSEFFRSAAMDGRQIKWLGQIVLVQPLSFTMLTMIALAMALIIGFFMAFGSYTKHSTVAGQLVPDVGVLKVYPAQPGVVMAKYVREGQWFKKGDILYLISTERRSSTQDDIQASISRQVALREQSFKDDLSHMRKLQQFEARALQKKIDGLQAEHENVIRQLAGQRLRIELADAAVNRSNQLFAQGFISTEMLQQKQADLLDQRNRLQALERDQINVERELQAQHSELENLPLRQLSQLAQIERLITSTGQEWTESEGKRRIALIAPESGVATAVTAEVGQAIDGGKPVVTIVPDGAMLQAHLFAPSRSIGFIRPGDHVLVRYQAYPYQKFGHAEGIVASVSGTALSINDLSGTSAQASNTGESLYRIIITLPRQTITVYGKRLPLKAGMVVEADILHERRKLYEWVLEPLYSLTGKT